VNTQPEIKSHCQKLLEEQEMSRRKIRKLISKAAFTMRDPTQCLKPWDWTFNRTGNNENRWSKIFTLPYPLLAEWNGRLYLQQKMIVVLWFFDYVTGLWIEPYPKLESLRYLH
jgi:hypothetical protein